MVESGPTVEYLKKHQIEAFVQEMVLSLKGKPGNPFKAMAEYVTVHKLAGHATTGAGSHASLSCDYSVTPRFLTPVAIGTGSDYVAAADGAFLAS
jgi:hypothetical protein